MERRKNHFDYYNQGRIIEYSYKLGSSLNGSLYLHKTIKPYFTKALRFGIPQRWIPYAYFYEKPKGKCYEAPLSKIWESRTGLPYNVAQELKINDDDITKFTENINKPNIDLLECKEKTFYVSSDSCNVEFYDHKAIDSDIIDIFYKDSCQRIILSESITQKTFILTQANNFKLMAISDGNIGPCTVSIKIENKQHILQLMEKEIINIKLEKLKDVVSN